MSEADTGRGEPGGSPGPVAFVRRTFVIEPGESRPHVEQEWIGILVVMTAGEIELRCRHGGARRFAEGSVLWFTGLDLRSVHNPGSEPAVFVAVSRGRP
ncbi:MAG: hypothetical protein OJJ54_20585 [Pseudonocardia sp.]|nr:hypothetical protein [Pseudonocardia sp.]